MPIDQTWVFRGRQSGQVQVEVSGNPNAAEYVASEEIGQAATQTGMVLSGIAKDQAARRDKVDMLRLKGLQEDANGQIQQIYQAYQNEPERWKDEIANVKKQYQEKVGKLQLSDGMKSFVKEANANYWQGVQNVNELNFHKYNAARDRETVVGQYEKYLQSGRVEEAQALVSDPAYKNILKPGEAEELAKNAPDIAAAHQAELIQSKISTSNSVNDLQALREDIDAGELSNLSEIQQNTLKASIENRSRELRYSVQGKNISQEFKLGAQGQWLTDEELDVGVSNETYSQEDADLYKLTRDNAFQAEQEQASEQRKAAIKEQRKVLISQDRDSEAYKSMKTRAGKLLLNVFEDGKDADIVAYEDLMNEISTTDALITPEARVELLNIVLRARSVDIQDGEIDKAGSWFDMKLEEDEIAFRNDFYGRMSELAKTNPIVSEAGTEFMKAESAIHNLFTREEPPTDEEKEEFMVMVFQPLFNLAAVRKMRGQQ